jgi:hypothetical protein
VSGTPPTIQQGTSENANNYVQFAYSGGGTTIKFPAAATIMGPWPVTNNAQGTATSIGPWPVTQNGDGTFSIGPYPVK